MNVLFLTMNNFESIYEHSLYPDLIRELATRCHSITVLSPIEKKDNIKTFLEELNNIRSIKVQTGNLFNVSIFEKAISRAFVCSKYKKALNKFCRNEKYDLVLFSTPPTTLASIARREKRRGAYVYLMLKDIFPQNAVDLGLIKKGSLAFKAFRIGERETYRVADTIGCMSPANVSFIKKQDPWINPQKLTICANAIEIRDNYVSSEEKVTILRKYGIPSNKLLFVYGGGLGKPQGIEFLIKCILAASSDEELFFVVIGSGPYLKELKELEIQIPHSIKVINWLPSDEYEKIVQSCDVGLIMLNHSFTVPNFPSRILLYMQAHLPILAATDQNTDVGKIIENNNFGFWCESNDVDAFIKLLSKFKNIELRKEMGCKSYTFLSKNYSVKIVADNILSRGDSNL